MCHLLTMVDDHSRYALCLQACSNEQAETVQQHLERTFRRYGLPSAFLVDNGVPWALLFGPVDQAAGLAAQARRRRHLRPSISPADQRQERAIPSHAEGRGSVDANLPRRELAALARATLSHKAPQGEGKIVVVSRIPGSPRWNHRPGYALLVAGGAADLVRRRPFGESAMSLGTILIIILIIYPARRLQRPVRRLWLWHGPLRNGARAASFWSC